MPQLAAFAGFGVNRVELAEELMAFLEVSSGFLGIAQVSEHQARVVVVERQGIGIVRTLGQGQALAEKLEGAFGMAKTAHSVSVLKDSAESLASYLATLRATH